MATNTNPITKTTIYADDTSNKEYPSIASEIRAGILFQGEIKSNQLNGIFHFSYVAMRFLQVTAGLYDNSQDYDKNEIATILTAENGIKRQRRYICKADSTTATPPFSGTNSSTSNDIEITDIDDTNTENPQAWDRLLDDNKVQVSTAITSNYMYLLCPSNVTNAEGRLRVKCYDDSSILTCSFYLEFLGFGYSEFNISTCIYSQVVRANRVSSQYGGIYYAGFGLMVTSDGVFLSVLDNSKCAKVVVEYSDCNFIPPLSSKESASPSSANKPYAIRNGGGTWIQDLGVIKNDYRANGNNALGETLEFYLFSNGFVRWTSAMTLNSNYFHQWANGGFGSLNIDASDKVLCNVGTTTGQSLGVIANASLPNIKGGWDGEFDGNNQAPTGYGWRYQTNVNGWKQAYWGAFDKGRKKLSYDLYDSSTTLESYGWQLNASLYDSTYQDNAKVNMERIPNFLVAQAF